MLSAVSTYPSVPTGTRASAVSNPNRSPLVVRGLPAADPLAAAVIRPAASTVRLVL